MCIEKSRVLYTGDYSKYDVNFNRIYTGGYEKWSENIQKNAADC